MNRALSKSLALYRSGRKTVVVARDNHGQLMFEQYAQEQGYLIEGPDIDLGTNKRPDYLVHAPGQDVVVEVESFKDPVLLPEPGSGGFVQGASPKRIREAISEAADQLKGIPGLPLVVVLANPLNIWLPLDPAGMIAAMYGDLQVNFPTDGELRWEAGRNGRLYVPLPDGGKQRGNHPHVSAVCIVQRQLRTDAELLTALNSTHDTSDALAMLERVLATDPSSGEATTATYLDVFETVSDVAVPLPRTVFNGPHDRRWGIVGPGAYGKIST